MITGHQLYNYALAALAVFAFLQYFFMTRSYAIGRIAGKQETTPKQEPKDEFLSAIEQSRKKGFIYYDVVSNYDC